MPSVNACKDAALEVRARVQRGDGGPVGVADVAVADAEHVVFDPGQEAADRFRGAQAVHGSGWGVGGDGPAEGREAAAPVGPDPAPVPGLFAATAQAAPGAAQETEVQHDHGVGRAQAQGQVVVVGSEIAVDDPFATLDQLVLTGGPLSGLGRCRPGRPDLPEQGVQFGHRKAGRAAKVMAQRRLARPATAQDHHASHLSMMGQATADRPSHNSSVNL